MTAQHPPETAGLVDRLIKAYTSRAWADLGYGTWRAFVVGEFGERRPRLPALQRKEAAAAMSSAGMSVRAIGAALGVDHRTAHLDIVGHTRRTSEGVCVYVIGSPQFRPVKIGKGYPRERLASFQVGSPFLLEILWTVPGSASLEKALQERFAEFHVRGEWFEFPEGVDPVQQVSDAAAEISADRAV